MRLVLPGPVKVRSTRDLTSNLERLRLIAIAKPAVILPSGRRLADIMNAIGSGKGKENENEDAVYEETAS